MAASTLPYGLALLGLLGFACAECQLSNSLKQPVSELYNNKKLCVPQGEGSWTFSFYGSMVEVPTFNSGSPNAGNAQAKSYLIYDNTCTVKGEYAPQGNDCGIPYVIKEDFLAQVLTITSVNMDVASPSFSFKYGNGKYTIGNNGCTCGDMSDGLEAATGCKCAFPLSGVL